MPSVLITPMGPVVAGSKSEKIERKSGPQTRSDDAAIRAILNELIDGWKSANGRAVAATFTEDGDLVAGDGTHKKGRVEIAQYMQMVFEKVFVGGRVSIEINSMRPLTNSVVLVHAKGGILMAGERSVPPDRLGLQTFVVTKQNGRWLIASFQNTRILQSPR
jgi:uncharacterized protein (TIGR02246 family)